MSRMGENIHKRKDGRWEARIATNCDGVRKYKSIYGRTYKDVKDKMLHFYEQAAGKNDSESKSTNSTDMVEVLTFSKVAEEWMATNQLRQKLSTQLKYQTLLEMHILPEFGGSSITEIDEKMINSFLANKLKNGSVQKTSNHQTNAALSHSYVRTMGILINSVISFGVRMGYRQMLRAPIVKPPESKKEIKVLGVSDLQKVNSTLQNDYSGTAIGIMLALNLGLRIGEVCALEWRDIDLGERIICIRHTVARVRCSPDEGISAKTKLVIDAPKTKTSLREIPINTALWKYLMEAQKHAVSEYVVSNKTNFVSPRTFEYRFHRLLEKCGVEDTNFHTLRHTFSTRCVELDVDMKSLSELLGHANVSTTLGIYVHSSIALKRNQLEKLIL